jgi:hypothetical protein
LDGPVLPEVKKMKAGSDGAGGDNSTTGRPSST